METKGKVKANAFNIKFNLKNIGNVLGIAVLIAILINIAFMFNFTFMLKGQLQNIVDINTSQEGKLIVINPADCEECKDVDDIKTKVKQSNILVSDELTLSSTDESAIDLIQKYEIERLPAIIFESDETINNSLLKSWKNGGKQIKNVFVWEQKNLPYFDTNSDEKIGIVKTQIIVNNDCDKCFDMSAFVDQIKKSGIYMVDTELVDFSSKEGKDLISQYDVKKVPYLIFSRNISAYEVIQKNLIATRQLNLLNDHFILQSIPAPHYDLLKDKVSGLVDVIYLTADDCGDCYDVDINNQLMQSMGVVTASKKYIDVDDAKGQAIVKEYNITKVPTVVYSSEFEVYDYPLGTWEKNFGTIEEDGSYIFRKPELFKGKYITLD